MHAHTPPPSTHTHTPTPQDATISTLATDVAAKLQALRGLKGKLGEVQDYLGAVAAGKLPLNHDINGHLQVGGRVGEGDRANAAGGGRARVAWGLRGVGPDFRVGGCPVGPDQSRPCARISALLRQPQHVLNAP